jgi:phosphatidylserine decarboxylase
LNGKTEFSRRKKPLSVSVVCEKCSCQAPSQAQEDTFEREELPLCHRPRLNKNTKVTVCERGPGEDQQENFITANQAQRKWYTIVISMVSSDYRLGAVRFIFLHFIECAVINLFINLIL